MIRTKTEKTNAKYITPGKDINEAKLSYRAACQQYSEAKKIYLELKKDQNPKKMREKHTKDLFIASENHSLIVVASNGAKCVFRGI